MSATRTVYCIYYYSNKNNFATCYCIYTVPTCISGFRVKAKHDAHFTSFAITHELRVHANSIKEKKKARKKKRNEWKKKERTNERASE